MHVAWITVLYDTSREEFERLQKEISRIDPAINFICVDNTATKKGYAQGVNEGIQKILMESKSSEQSSQTKKLLNHIPDIFIISNPDISVKNITLQNIQDVSGQFDIAGFAMKQQGSVFYGGEVDRWRMSGGLKSEKPSQQFHPVDFVSGSLMILKRDVIERIGFFDESFGMYYEDVDYCIRARRAGFKVGIDATTHYRHFETSDEKNPQKHQLLAKNRLRILLQYGDWKQKSYELIRAPKTFYEYFR